ncbi:NCS2 family permease [Egicoccus halophilus]|uniref:Guanine permease n=1 Tax=Egicoccus halophilus TaxID=1670830 RepID=A0A8J3AC76_9ACTN|nr:NCS2 family permease [Egicoccus halophilus]GGI03349.1 guanine permease [Egicoccus halophilus]
MPEQTRNRTRETASGGSPLERFFRLREHGTDVRTELVAGLTTFLAMAYIVFVNPDVLGAAGLDTGAVFVATCLAAALGTLIMGLYANFPIAQAPGMGLNAFFAYTVVIGLGVPWETALAGTFVSGVLFLVLALTGVREAVINAIPLQLKLAVGAGIGLFIAFIGLKNAGIVVEAAPGTTVVELGDLGTPTTLLAIFGILVTCLFLMRGLRGAIFYGIVATALAGVVFGINDLAGVVAPVPSLSPTLGAAFGALPELLTVQMLVVVFTMLFVDFFDTAGTLIAVSNQAGLLDEQGRLPRANRALVSDSVATMGGAMLGTSTTTSYIESSAGVGTGGRTGLTSVSTAALFLLALFFSPLLSIVSGEVTAAALILVGVMMARGLGQIEWDRLEYAIPAFVTVVAMPLTYSIATGIALGLLLFPLMMLFKGRVREVHPVMWVLLVAFAAYFLWLAE